MRTESTIRSDVFGLREGGAKCLYQNTRHNLTTDTAAGFTNRRDWQSKAMGWADVNAAYSGAATAVTATTLTAAGTFPTAGQALAGRVVVAAPNSAGAGSRAFGVIVSNTATILTVDRWYDPGTLGAGTLPNATANYVILPGQFPSPYIAVTESATAASAADTVLATELAIDGFTRALGTYSHTAAATTYSLQVVFNATGTRTINKTALSGSAVTSIGVMPFESAMPSPPTLVSGDQLTETYTITIS